MPRSSYGSGTIFKRGAVWYVAYWVNGRQVQKSSRSQTFMTRNGCGIRFLDANARGEMVNRRVERITCVELLDDLIERAEANSKPLSVKIWKLVIEANVRPFFGNIRASALTTETLNQGKSETTCNRELSILRVALNLGRKCTPPKVNTIPYFPMVREENAFRHGLLHRRPARGTVGLAVGSSGLEAGLCHAPRR